MNKAVKIKRLLHCKKMQSSTISVLVVVNRYYSLKYIRSSVDFEHSHYQIAETGYSACTILRPTPEF